MAILLVGLTPPGGVGVSVRLPAITKADASSTKQADDAYPFWLLFDESSTCIAQLDLQLRVVGGNAGFIAVFGLDVGTFRGCEIINLVYSSVREKLSSQLQSLVSGDRGRFTDHLVTAPGCGTANLGITGISVTNDTGGVESLIILVQPERIDSVPAHPAGVREPLTKVDAGVLEGVASGMSTVKLATNLFLSRGGVEYHVNALMKRLKAGNRSELVSKAYAAGLFSIGMWPSRVISDFVE
jgi:DNA-binding CsgD family transcriptional regulator